MAARIWLLWLVSTSGITVAVILKCSFLLLMRPSLRTSQGSSTARGPFRFRLRAEHSASPLAALTSAYLPTCTSVLPGVARRQLDELRRETTSIAGSYNAKRISALFSNGCCLISSSSGSKPKPCSDFLTTCKTLRDGRRQRVAQANESELNARRRGGCGEKSASAYGWRFAKLAEVGVR